MLHVSVRSVAAAAQVYEHGIAGIVHRVEQGEIAVSLAAKIVMLPEVVQDELLDADEATLRNAVKRHSRAQREADMAAATLAAAEQIGHGLYGVLYADPPWRFAPYSDNGMDRAADNHYQTMTTPELCAMADRLPIAEDAVLFLWATVPMLPDAIEVMEAWGFNYRSHFVWVKTDHIGTGYWNRNRHELLLVGTRGTVPAPAPGEQYPSVIEAEPRAHSAKPEVFVEMIDEMFPTSEGLELFARSRRAGWVAWGNEVMAA